MRRLTGLLALAALASACSKPTLEDKVVGTWLSDPPMAASLKNDPTLATAMAFLKDTVRLDLRGDHTYTLRYFVTKRGTWKLTSRLVTFEETDSRSDFPFLSGDFDFGKPAPSGKRAYTAVFSDRAKTLTLLMGPKMGDVTFHR